MLHSDVAAVGADQRAQVVISVPHPFLSTGVWGVRVGTETASTEL